MWWSRTPAALALLVAACGFTPVHGPGGTADGLSGRIAVAPPRDEPGYLLVRHLEDRLGRADAPAYRLDAEIGLDTDGLGVTAGQEITRIRLIGRLDYALVRIATDEVLARGRVESFTGYSAPVFTAGRNSIAGNSVTVRSAERDATERLMTILADQLVSRLLATADTWRR